MTKLKIKVTKDILHKSSNCVSGNIKSPMGSHCAIALAVRDIFPEAFVGRTAIRFDGVYALNTIELPAEATVFIDEFDTSSPNTRRNMNEIEFEVEIPDNIIERINIDELKPLLENHPTLSLAQ